MRRRGAWVVAVLALVLLGVLAGGAAYLLSRSAEPGTLQVTTTPADTVVLFDGEPVPALASPFVITDVEPEVAHSLEVRKHGYRPWSTEVTVEAGETRQLAGVTLEPLDAGPAEVADAGLAGAQEASVDAGPGSGEPYAFADEQELAGAADAPRTARVGRRGGTRRRGHRAGREPRIAAAPVEPTTTTPAPAPAPEPAAAPRQPAGTGALDIRTRPWSQVFVDGRLVGTTPQRNIWLSPGRHRLLLVNPDFHIRRTLDVDIRAGQTTTRELTLTP